MFDIRKFHKYDHLIWDWNGTLIDDVKMNLGIMNEQLAGHGLAELSDERHREIFGFPLRKFYKQLGFDASDHSFEQVSREFMEIYEQRKNRCRLHPQCFALLKSWRRSGKKQSILSAYPQVNLLASLQFFQIEDYFQFIVGAANHHGESKIEVGKQLLHDIRLPQKSIALIGDTVHDYEVAAAMGVDCFLVTSGNQSMCRLRATGATILKLENVEMEE